MDSALANLELRVRFLKAIVSVLAKIGSDHHPLLIHLDKRDEYFLDRPFRYEPMWQQHFEFNRFLSSNWNAILPLHKAITDLTPKLSHWNKTCFGHLFKKKRRLLNRLGRIQKAQSYGRNPFLDDLKKLLRSKLEAILEQEEIHWHQKSRGRWFVEGD